MPIWPPARRFLGHRVCDREIDLLLKGVDSRDEDVNFVAHRVPAVRSAAD